jgi:hypothetical protein
MMLHGQREERRLKEGKGHAGRDPESVPRVAPGSTPRGRFAVARSTSRPLLELPGHLQ